MLLVAVGFASPGHAAAAPASPRARPAARATKATARHPALPFIEDDFGRALALARARRLPVFIEGWAPW
jgi:hypothetical protein